MTPDRRNDIIEDRAVALSVALAKLEDQWDAIDDKIGIGYEIDDETGKMTISFGPEDGRLAVRIVTDIHSVFVGEGPTN